MSGFHQIVPTLRPGDAVGGHTLRMRGLLRDLGFESEIFVEHAHPALAGEVRPVDDYLTITRSRGGRPSAVMYQLAVGAASADLFFTLPETRVVDYHNITPPEFFWGWDDVDALRTLVGRMQLERLGRRVEFALADSSFNADDLRAHGYRCPVEVVPILLDLDAFDREVDRAALRSLERAKRRGGVDLLFVGRFVPNKAQHDLIRALAVYRRLYDPDARLHLVGGPGPKRYLDALRRLADGLGLADAVTFAVDVPQGRLVAHYQAADAFVCASEHEGFCIPLLEAMHHGLPVVAHAAAAVPETLADAGLSLAEKDPLTLAAAVHRVVDDADLRARLVGSGFRRLGDFALERTTRRFVEALEPVLDRVPA